MGTKKILFVDDEVDFLALLKKVMEFWGYEVVTALNAEEAMILLKSEKPDILVLDYLMPGVNGIELLRKMRDKATTAPAIMFTAEPTIKAMEESKRLNILAFIPKLSPHVDTQADLRIALDLISKGC